MHKGRGEGVQIACKNAYVINGRPQSKVAVTRMSVLSLISFRRYIFVFTIDKHVCVKDSSAEGTCNIYE